MIRQQIEFVDQKYSTGAGWARLLRVGTFGLNLGLAVGAALGFGLGLRGVRRLSGRVQRKAPESTCSKYTMRVLGSTRDTHLLLGTNVAGLLWETDEK